MKCSLLYLSFFLFPFIGFSQINTSLDFIGGVDIGYRTIRTTDDDPNQSLNLATLNDGQAPNINVRFGFNLNQRIGNKIFFKTGLRFVTEGYKWEESTLRWGSQQSGGVFNPELSGEPAINGSFVYKYLFIELPLMARFELSQKKFSPYLELGVSPSLFLTTSNKHIINGESIPVNNVTDSSDFSKISFVGVFSFGGNYNINDGLQIFAQPTIRYHLTETFKNAPLKYNLFNAGLELGIRKRLK